MLNVHDFLSSQGDEYKKLSFKDLLFVHYRCPQQEQFMSVYTHLNYFLYVVSGRKMFHQPGQSYALNEGSCAFIRKGGYTQERFFDIDWILMAFFVPDNYLKSIAREYRSSIPVRPAVTLPDKQVFTLAVNDITKDFFASMLPYFSQPALAAEPIVELKFRELLYNLLSNPENQVLLSLLDVLNDKDGPDLRVIMEANYLYNLSLPEFARIAHRSLSAFKKDFSLTFRTTPGKWLLNRRLENAEFLLHTSHTPVTEIADTCGFESQTHFNRVFREKFGLSPLQYRKHKEPQR